jgi:hypothetical protein
MPHDHGRAHIDPASGDRRVSIAIWASGLLTMVHIVRGVLSGSLAHIAAALHNFSDTASLVVAFAARKIAQRPAGVFPTGRQLRRDRFAGAGGSRRSRFGTKLTYYRRTLGVDEGGSLP